MDKQDDEPMVTITLELPAIVVSQLEEMREQYGEELVADIVMGALKTVQSKLALYGVLVDKNCQ